MQTDRGLVPLDYMQVTRAYLRPVDVVLDVDCGSGERFIELAPTFAHDTGVLGCARIRTP